MEGIVKKIKASKSGPNLVVMAGVHGDEICGLRAIDAVVSQLEILKGSITFLVGSPKAVATGTREFESNLNRMFRSEKQLTVQEMQTYEYRRSRELMPLLKNADALLDLHSSTTGTTEPFVICEEKSYACAASLPVSIVVSGFDALHPMGTDAYVNQCGGLGICIECGNHTDASAEYIAVTAIQNFIAYFGMCKRESMSQLHTQRHIRATCLYKNKSVFTLAKNFSEFEKVGEGTVVGTDGVNKVKAPYDSVIIFPQNCSIPHKEAFVLGREIDLH